MAISSCSSDSEDEDPYSWVLQRRQLKRELEVGAVSHAPLHTSHNLHQTHRVPPEQNDRVLPKQNTTEVLPKQNAAQVFPKENAVKVLPKQNILPKQSAVQVQNAAKVKNAAKVENAATVENAAKTQSAKSCSENKSSKHSGGDADRNGRNEVTTQRQRSSDSLTLSSSLSDGDMPSSDGTTGCSGDQAEQTSTSKGTSNRGGGGHGGKSKKQGGKKSKKSRKKEQSSPVKKERSLASQKRRAYVLQRIRSDSLNTSSDEENSLSSSGDTTNITTTTTSDDTTPDTNGNSKGPPHPLLSLSGPGGRSPSSGNKGTVDVEAMKAELKRRIMSKKPPAHFETPATEPVFHEVGTFLCWG